MALTTDIYQRIVSAKMYIDENYHEAIDLENVSQQAFLSRFHFHRLFTRVYRKTPHQYLTQTRMEAAKRLLKNDHPNISEICNNVGFESPASFSLLFKKQSGYSPQYYRNMARLKKKQAAVQPKKFIPHCHIQQFGIGK